MKKHKEKEAALKEKKERQRKNEIEGLSWSSFKYFLSKAKYYVLAAEEENDEPAVWKGKMKLLQFHENRRPPYYGTFSKTSSTVLPRRPFGREVLSRDKVISFDLSP